MKSIIYNLSLPFILIFCLIFSIIVATTAIACYILEIVYKKYCPIRIQNFLKGDMHGKL